MLKENNADYLKSQSRGNPSGFINIITWIMMLVSIISKAEKAISAAAKVPWVKSLPLQIS